MKQRTNDVEIKTFRCLCHFLFARIYVFVGRILLELRARARMSKVYRKNVVEMNITS
jgi:hypothetical protein